MSRNVNGTNSAIPRVSVGMPVYIGEDHIAEAIESVLSQTFSDLELIICDNASTDRTGEICREYAAQDSRIRYYRHTENLGAARNFNRTIELSRGEFFNWFAHDDILAPTYLEQCVEMFEQGPPSVVLCFPQRVRITYDGQVWRDKDRRPWYEASPPYDRLSFARLMRVPDRHIPGMLFGLARSRVLTKTQLIRPICYSDLVLVTQLRLLGEFREVPEPLFMNRSHRITADNKDSKRRNAREELLFYNPKTKIRTCTSAGALMVLLMTRLELVRHSSFPAHRKAIYMFWVVFGHVVIRTMTPFAMLRLRVLSMVRRTWEFTSVKLLRLSGNHILFHRLWVLLAGLRHRDRALVSLALSSSSQSTREKLLAYIANRLQQRGDVHARQLLVEWIGRRPEVDRCAEGVTGDSINFPGNEESDGQRNGLARLVCKAAANSTKTESRH